MSRGSSSSALSTVLTDRVDISLAACTLTLVLVLVLVLMKLLRESAADLTVCDAKTTHRDGGKW